MKSMQVFLKQHNAENGIRLSLEKFSQYGTISIVPLYAANIVYIEPMDEELVTVWE